MKKIRKKKKKKGMYYQNPLPPYVSTDGKGPSGVVGSGSRGAMSIGNTGLGK
jgi:hypothetical protein